MATTPAVFIGHGSPSSAIQPNEFTASWSEFAAMVEKPKAILSISAHWFIGATAVTAMERPRTIHDFYGFPDEMFAIQYPAPGSLELAERAAGLITSVDMMKDNGEWGLDHGTWAPLLYLYPGPMCPWCNFRSTGERTLIFISHLARNWRL